MSERSAERAPVGARVASLADLDALTAILSAAFAHDPLWSWVFPDRDDLAIWWRLCIRGAMRYPWTWITEEHSAASLWIPPEGCELATEDEARVPQLIESLCGDRSAAVMELLGRFESARPRAPHYYLSLLGTDPDQRGRGLGMALLADNLARIDDTGMPAYLESSNPANDPRYERVGFRRIGEFTTPDGKHTVATMWRDAR